MKTLSEKEQCYAITHYFRQTIINNSAPKDQHDKPLATEKILTVLNSILAGEQPSLLYKNYLTLTNKPLINCPASHTNPILCAHHYGQMTRDFALSANQRNALHYFMQQPESSIVALNGPPGTGKTTLIGSVVADLWVKAALLEREPPLILAASNNNQAVTNILASFARLNETTLEPTLAGRWLPDISSYGLYLCSQQKANQDNEYAYHAPDNTGLMAGLQTLPYLTKANAYFLAKADDWLGTPQTNLHAVQQALHSALTVVSQEITTIFTYLEQADTHEAKIINTYGSIKAFDQTLLNVSNAIKALDERIALVQQDLADFFCLWDNRSLWQKILAWFATFTPVMQRDNEQLLLTKQHCLLHITDQAIKAHYQQLLGSLRDERTKQRQYLRQLKKTKQQTLMQHQMIDQWLARYSKEKPVTLGKRDNIMTICDTILRFKAFKLATHYWEARWLDEAWHFVAANDADKKSPAKLLRKWYRFAKLTPCFVSTFYTGPSAFLAFEKKDEGWCDVPLFNSIDLLIVDEAGQALANMAAPLFALAKKALIVGDVDQIEPVWELSQALDYSYLEQCSLINDEEHDDEFWLNSGLMASNGNLMRVAQRRCCYQQFKQLQRGLYLTEHRRCFDPIINFCNQLVYQGVLEPRRGLPTRPSPWPTMAFIPVYGDSRRHQGSRVNDDEARAIAQWLHDAMPAMLNHARAANEQWRAQSDSEVMMHIAAIVTPFAEQALLIKQVLKKYNVPNLTVGTVHSLQGAERLFILFSSVYGANEQVATKFYDQKPNMLNVAVSRAKDHFFVFGHPDSFGLDDHTPSAYLRQALVRLPAASRPSVVIPA